MAQRNLHKRGKVGELPGDINLGAKIKMLESKTPFYYHPWQKMRASTISGYRNDHYKKVKTSHDRRMEREVREQLD